MSKRPISDISMWMILHEIEGMVPKLTQGEKELIVGLEKVLNASIAQRTVTGMMREHEGKKAE